MPHTTRVSIEDENGEVFYCARKIARWLEENGRAKWITPDRMALLHEARELRVRGVTLQVVPLSPTRRKRGGRTSVHVKLPADRRPTPLSQRG